MTAASGDLADVADPADVDELADVADPADVDRLMAPIELAHARRLARAGHYTEADEVLTLARTTPAGLDLRARIAAQQERYDEAVALWSDAAARRGDPDAYAAELAALDRRRQRRHGAAPLVAAGVILGGALAAGGGWAAADRWSTSEDRIVAEAGVVDRDAPAERLGDHDAETGTTATTSATTTTVEAAEPPPPADVLEQRLGDVAGVEVAASEDGAVAVTFTAPVFSEGVTLTPAGEAALTGVAAVLASGERDGDRIIVVVTGHTDGLPLRPGSRYADNDQLAIARAQAGVDRLVLGGLPTERTTVDVTATSPLDRTIGLAIYPQSPQPPPG